MTFKWVLPTEIPAAGAKGSLTITVQAGSERFAPAMAIQSPMVVVRRPRRSTAGSTCTTGGTVQIGGVAEKGESKTFTQAFTLKGPAADIQLGIQDGPQMTYSYAAASSHAGLVAAMHRRGSLQGAGERSTSSGSSASRPTARSPGTTRATGSRSRRGW